MSNFHRSLSQRRRAEQQAAEEAEWERTRRIPNPGLPSPTQPLPVHDGDLLLIGSSGAVDEKGYRELVRRYGVAA